MGLGAAREDGLRVLSDVDLVSTDDLRRMAEVAGPCVTIYLPTERFGPGTRSGPARLHHLASRAAALLAEDDHGPAEVEELLAPIRRLGQDELFWQHLSDGLALFAGPGFFEGFRLALSVPERVVVDQMFRLLPLVSQVAGDTTFHVLALAQNSVRILRATEHTVAELDLPGLPQSMVSALPEAEPDRVRGVHSVGALGAITHGQGTEADYDKRALERFFREVDDAVVSALARHPTPLVLAGVAYYVPIYQSVSRYPAVWPQAVEGNPERRSAQELHDAAWTLLADHFAEGVATELARYRAVVGTGRTAAGAKEVLDAAREGRVEVLLLDAHAAQDDELLERAVAETFRGSGRVVSLAAEDALDAPAVALLRY